MVARAGEGGVYEGFENRKYKARKRNEMQGGLCRITFTVDRKKYYGKKKKIDTNIDMYLRIMITDGKWIRNN